MSTAYHDMKKADQILFLDWLENEYQDEIVMDYEIENEFVEFLDECYGEVEVAGFTYSTSELLRSTDPTAFRCSCDDWSAELFIEVHYPIHLKTERVEELVSEYLESKEV